MRKNKAIIDDGCNPELVDGAEFDMPLGIPIIKAPAKILIPSGITPFSMRNHTDSFSDALGFYEMDINFAEVLRKPENYINDFGRFSALISPDCSLYRDAPPVVQATNIYKNRAVGSYYQRNGLNAIPQIRWGNEMTYTTRYFPEKIAFLGVEKHSIVAIGTYGCIKGKENKYFFEAGLYEMMDTLMPEVVLVYGSMPDSIFGQYKNYARFIEYPDWTTKRHRME